MTLDDDLILLQIELLRYDVHLQKQIAKKLKITQKELIELLSENKINGRNIKSVKKKTQAIINEGFNDVAAYLSVSLSDSMPVIAMALATVYQDHTGKKFNEPVTHNLPNVGGASIDEWLKKQAQNSQFTANRFAVEVMEGKELSEVYATIAALIARNTHQANALAATARAAITNDVNTRMMMNSRAVKQLQHKSHLDTRTSGTCRQRHNKRWNKATLKPIGHNLEFKAPPLHFNCRSIIKPLLTDETPTDDNYSFEDWLNNMPENVQDKALGKGKAKLWRKARLEGRKPFTINDLLDQRGRELTLEQLQKRYE